MPEPIYTVEPDGYGDPTIWKHERENDPSPIPVATDNRASDYHPEAFRAAAAVLAPDDEVHRLIRVAASKVGTKNGLRLYDARHDIADEVLAALKAHATGGEQS